MSKLTEYLSETRTEMKHVNWPTRQQAALYTGVVILVSVVTAFFLGAFDALFAYLLRVFIGA